MSSKRRLRRNQCGRKVRHVDEAAERGAIHSLRRAYGGAMGFMRAYRCPFCGGWHIGHVRSGGRS